MKKLYVVTRLDLPSNVQAVQAGHAVAQYMLWNQTNEVAWKNEILVYLAVKDLKALAFLRGRLHQRFIDYIAWAEPDMNNQLTAIATDVECNVINNLKLMGT